MDKILAILCIVTILYLVLEKQRVARNRRKLRHVIHVNGTRGKSTVCRLIDAGLRAHGYRVFTKVTGTAPVVIDCDNLERPIQRISKANIKEQIEALVWATREKADILVVECMAVNPSYQRISQDSILQADINVITNVRMDHLDEMGENLEDIAKALSNTIPQDGVVFTCEVAQCKILEKVAREKNAQIIYVSFPDEKDIQKYSEIDFADNVAISLAVCEYLGVGSEIAYKAMLGYKKDSGVLSTYSFVGNNGQKSYFVNAMAANDPDSTQIILDRYISDNRSVCNATPTYLPINLLLSIRGDRMSRALQYVDFIAKNKDKFAKILVYGDTVELVKRKIKKKIDSTINIYVCKDVYDYGGEIIFAVGNICGKGQKLLESMEKIS